ncbi:MAG: TRAP transporter substrate-binding protein [Lachnospiraceae bacterium]|jgi:tripartite ATP-independent transporter DctP family solute receptor|nr:TRAP transporter substrate-binding protein [Lachnospiraceae bacterium]
MKKKRTLTVVLLVLTMLVTAGCGKAQEAPKAEESTAAAETAKGEENTSEGETYTIIIPQTQNESDPQVIAYHMLEEALEERSEGRIQVEVYSGGTISSGDTETLQLVASNSAQIGNCPNYTLAESIGVKALYIWDYPFLFQSSEEMYQIMDDPDFWSDVSAQIEENSSLKVYSNYVNSWQLICNSKRAVASPEDLSGLKIRTSTAELYVSTINALGGNATPMAWGEVFSALQQGTVDGAFVASTLFDLNKFSEVQKFATDVNPNANLQIVFINRDFYNSLPEDLQKIVDEEMDNFVTNVRKLCAETEAKAWDSIENSGVEVTHLSEEQRAAFTEAGKVIWDEKADVAGEEIVSLVREKLGR